MKPRSVPHRWSLTIPCAVALATAGCATLTAGIHQAITINTPGVKDAVCNLMVEDAVIARVATTPATVTIRKRSEPLTVSCEKAGYKPSRNVVKPLFNGNTTENLLLGGGVLMVWVAVDEISNAHWYYPDLVEVAMEPNSKSQKEQAPWRIANKRLEDERNTLEQWQQQWKEPTWFEPPLTPATIMGRMKKVSERDRASEFKEPPK